MQKKQVLAVAGGLAMLSTLTAVIVVVLVGDSGARAVWLG